MENKNGNYTFVSERDAHLPYRLVKWTKNVSGNQYSCTDILNTKTGDLMTGYDGDASVNYLGESSELVITEYDGYYAPPFDLSTGEFINGINLDEHPYSEERISGCDISVDGKKCLLGVESYSPTFDSCSVNHYYEINLSTKEVQEREYEFLKNGKNRAYFGYKTSGNLSQNEQPNNE